MIKIFAHTLNTFPGDNPYGVHPICHFALDTLVAHCPDQFARASSVGNCDCVLTNAPAAPPYSFDQRLADAIVSQRKPIYVINDADGAPPDCEFQSPDAVHNFCNFVRGGNGIRAYFYREWFAEYERNDLPFPLLTFELVGYLWTNHPKDQADYFGKDTFDEFASRPRDILFAQSLNCQSRIVLYEALRGMPKCELRDLNKTGKLPMTVMLRDQAQSKMTIALEGSGVKCCSTHEAPLNSVMVTGDIDMHWTYPWIHGDNCIRLMETRNKAEGSLVHNFGRGLINRDSALETIRHYLDRPEDLYGIFKRGVETARKYSLPEYYRNHVGASIIKYM